VLNQDKAADGEDELDSYHHDDEFHSYWRLRILCGLHAPISPFWIRVLETHRLSEGTVVDRGGFRWMRFPLRDMAELETNPNSFTINGCTYYGDTAVGPFYHNTPLDSLMGLNPHAPNSRGILEEGFLRGGKRGVNFYVDGGYETFSLGDSRCQLELWVNEASALRGGRRGRVACTPGEQCTHAIATHLCVKYDEVPDPVKLA